MHLLLGYHCEVLQYSLKTGLFFCIFESTQSNIDILSLTDSSCSEIIFNE